MKIEVKKYRFFKGKKTLGIVETHNPTLRLAQLRKQLIEAGGKSKKYNWVKQKDIKFELYVEPKKNKENG